MPAALLFCQPFAYITNADGTPAVGAQLWVYEAGSSTPVDVYTDSDLGVAWDQPIVMNAAGKSTGPIFTDSTPSLKIVVLDADDVPVSGFPVDDVSPYELA